MIAGAAAPVKPNCFARDFSSASIALLTASMRRAVSGLPVLSNLPSSIAVRTLFGTSLMLRPKMSITACLKMARVALFRFFWSWLREDGRNSPLGASVLE